MNIQQLYTLYQAHPEVSIDSRKIKPGCLFFALKGAHFNGNAYAQAALEAGASAAIIDEPAFYKGTAYVLVEDVLSVLQQLASHHRQKFEIPLIAITGSNGKTTTKELTSAVLKSHYKTHVTKGNFNNHIGLPLTLLAMPADTEVAVIEMGANHSGEIAQLCRIAAPTHGLITNIGKAHLEGFGSLEGVRKAKGELFDWLGTEGGTAFVNTDEAWLEEMSQHIGHRVFYRQADQPDPQLPVLETILLGSSPTLSVAFRSNDGSQHEVHSQIYGSYNFNNIMTAISIGRYFKVPGDKVKQAIESYVPANNRSQLLAIGSNQYILDAYNANPSSMRSALEHFDRLPGRKIAVLGDMLELGEVAEAEHKALLQIAQEGNFDQIWLVGPLFRAAAGANEPALKIFSDVEALKEWFDGKSFEGITFLLKGSRGMGLEKLVH